MANLFPETIKLIEQIYGPKKDYPIDSDKEQLKDLATKAAIENSTKTPEEKEKTERKTLLDRRSYDLVEFDRNKVFTGEIKPGVNKRIKYLPYIRNKVGTIIFDTDVANTYENRRFQIPFHTKKLSKNQLIKTVKTQYEEFIYKQEDVDPIKKKIDELTNANGKLTEAINTKDTKIKTLQTTIANIKPCEPPAVTEIPAPIPAPAPAPVTVPPPMMPNTPGIQLKAALISTDNGTPTGNPMLSGISTWLPLWTNSQVADVFKRLASEVLKATQSASTASEKSTAWNNYNSLLDQLKSLVGYNNPDGSVNLARIYGGSVTGNTLINLITLFVNDNRKTNPNKTLIIRTDA
jgi:hypothetical protein